jgi:hypothetical protein
VRSGFVRIEAAGSYLIMSDLKRHHYVGQFLLESWCGADGNLCVYINKGGRSVCDRHTPRHTVNLYTVEAFAEADTQVVEKVAMNKMVDSARLRNSYQLTPMRKRSPRVTLMRQPCETTLAALSKRPQALQMVKINDEFH